MSDIAFGGSIELLGIGVGVVFCGDAFEIQFKTKRQRFWVLLWLASGFNESHLLTLVASVALNRFAFSKLGFDQI